MSTILAVATDAGSVPFRELNWPRKADEVEAVFRLPIRPKNLLECPQIRLNATHQLKSGQRQESPRGQIQGDYAGLVLSNQADKLPPPLAIPPIMSDPQSRDTTTEALAILARLRHKRAVAEAKGPEALKEFMVFERFGITMSECVLAGTEESTKPFWWHEANLKARREFFGESSHSDTTGHAQAQQPYSTSP